MKSQTLARRLGEGTAKIILKVLTKLVLGLLIIYKCLSKFIKGKYSGLWILCLIGSIIFLVAFFNNRLVKKQRNYQELHQKHERQLEEYQDLMEQKYELEKKLENVLTLTKPIYRKYPRSSLTPEIKEIIVKYAIRYKVNVFLLECMVVKESGGNPSAVSSNGKYIGVAQYCLSTFLAHRQRLGLSEEDLRTDPDASIELMANALAKGEYSHWPRVYPACAS